MATDPHSLVAPYALDALEAGEERRFEEHLALCERCREDLAGLREAAASLAYGAPETMPPTDLKERILAQARSERPNVVPLRRRRRSWTAPLAASGFAVGRGTPPARSRVTATTFPARTARAISTTEVPGRPW